MVWGLVLIAVFDGGRVPTLEGVSQLRSSLLCVVLHRVHFAHPVLTVVTPARGLGEMEGGEGGCRLSEALVESAPHGASTR